MDIIHQEPIAPGDPYVFIEWDVRNPTLTMGGGLDPEVDIPDLIERLLFVARELRDIQEERR